MVLGEHSTILIALSLKSQSETKCSWSFPTFDDGQQMHNADCSSIVLIIVSSGELVFRVPASTPTTQLESATSLTDRIPPVWFTNAGSSYRARTLRNLLELGEGGIAEDLS